MVDQFSSSTIISMVPGQINSPLVNPSSLLAYNSNVTYTFNVTPADTVP
jgi:hypothetical protein